MATITPPYLIGNDLPVNSIATNRITSTFKIIGGPRPPNYTYLVYNDVQQKFVILDLKPSYEGQVIYSNTIGDLPTNFTVIKYRARLFVARTFTGSNGLPELRWVPVVSYYTDSYIDPSTKRDWDPLGAYTCNPAYLCPSTS